MDAGAGFEEEEALLPDGCFGTWVAGGGDGQLEDVGAAVVGIVDVRDPGSCEISVEGGTLDAEVKQTHAGFNHYERWRWRWDLACR